MAHLWDALSRAYDALGFDEATGGEAVFRQPVLARIIEPTSKEDSIRVLDEVGVGAASYATIKRRLPLYAQSSWRHALAAESAARAALGPASLVLYDVTTLYFETHQGDGFREPGFSKERRLEPQITVGLLTDAAGMPLMIETFEGNPGAEWAETKTMLPTIRSFMTAHHLVEVTVVADAGMVSEANREAIEDAGLSYIIGARIPEEPHQVRAWRAAHPETEIPDGHDRGVRRPARGRLGSLDVRPEQPMPQVMAEVVVPIPPDAAFAVSQTHGELRLRWDPFIRRQYFLHGAIAPGKGVHTMTHARLGPRMESQYVSYRPPTSVGMTMVAGPWFFEQFGGGWRFVPETGPNAESGTRAVWKYTFTTRPSWLRPVADRIGSLVLGREIRRRIDAFAAACRDEEIVAAALAAQGSQQPEERSR